MNIFLWVLQVLLALVFLAVGGGKVIGGREMSLKRGLKYAEDFTDMQIRLIGLAELLGGLGLILPAATGIAPVLTPLAATGLAITMLGGTIVHIRRNEMKEAVVPAVLMVLAVIVAWGRFGPYAF
ncbi:MAG TPA: DoxX family protein [Micromonosporaceae bacterium]|nr:DoxX family protein [Micromonosporaceae bacterium]